MKLRFLIIILLSGCVSNHRNFTLYKNKLFQSQNDFAIKGVYFLKDFTTTKYYDRPHAIFFYADGSISAYNTNQISKIPESNFWAAPEEYLSSVDFSSSPGEPGFFTINNDTLIIEFITYSGGISVTGLNRFEGIIGKDSTILLTKQVCHWCPKRIEEFPDNGVQLLEGIQYNFYKTKYRPDSGRINSNWAKKHVWNQK